MPAELWFLRPLVLTLLFELTGAYLCGIRRRRCLGVVVLVNVITNPLLQIVSGLLSRMLSALPLKAISPLMALIVTRPAGAPLMALTLMSPLMLWALSFSGMTAFTSISPDFAFRSISESAARPAVRSLSNSPC